jgi:hypothetical protein
MYNYPECHYTECHGAISSFDQTNFRKRFVFDIKKMIKKSVKVKQREIFWKFFWQKKFQKEGKE